ncbi:uncharacterized protein JCM6883_002475 [Sporobolomyces salmoneus]|uniref:uncharacterized protein n=1 Tax=Sporobolomyces salmoneus TaxID=183962 RepID=UPI0031829366
MPSKSKPIHTPNRPSSSGSNRVETAEPRVGSPIPQIPGRSSPGGATPTFGSPRQTTQYLSASPSGGQRPRNSTSPSPYDTPSSGPPPSDSPQLTEAQKAEVIRRHLLSVDEQKRVAQEQQSLSSGISLGSSSPRSTSAQFSQQQQATTDSENDSTFPTPYHLEGGDVVAGVYKWAAQQAAEGGGNGSNESGVGLRRSKSFGSAIESSSRRQSHAAAGPGGDASRAAFRAGLEGGGEGDVEELTEAGEFSTSEMLQPGGFRRDFVYRKAMQERENNSQFDGESLGVAPDASDISIAGSMADSSRRPPARVATRSFIDFLSLYGHFGGEDLEEIDEEDEEEDEEADIDGVPSSLSLEAPKLRLLPAYVSRSTYTSNTRSGQSRSRNATSCFHPKMKQLFKINHDEEASADSVSGMERQEGDKAEIDRRESLAGSFREKKRDVSARNLSPGPLSPADKLSEHSQ